MDRKNLDRYKRILLEKRGEMSVTTAEIESPIPAAGGQRGDPVEVPPLHPHSLGQRLALARPAEIQFLRPA